MIFKCKKSVVLRNSYGNPPKGIPVFIAQNRYSLCCVTSEGVFVVDETGARHQIGSLPLKDDEWFKKHFEITQPMTYEEKASRTDLDDYSAPIARLQDVQTVRMLHAAIGLATEAGELLDMLKKHIFYGKPIDQVNAKEEVGGTMWYVALACKSMGTRLADIQDLNIAKLQKRFPERFTEEAAVNRDVERMLLEGDFE